MSWLILEAIDQWLDAHPDATPHDLVSAAVTARDAAKEATT